MKPWLFNLLACPICKYFPLKLYIFTFDSREETFKHYLNSYRNKPLEYHLKHQIPEIVGEEEIYLKDNIVIEKTPQKDYLTKLLSIIDEFNFIIDKSSSNLSKECFSLAKGEIRDKIAKFLNNSEGNSVQSLIPELNFLNKLLVETEIGTGILFCEHCSRWYPIIDTIPSMLPDEYRIKEKDLQFFKKYKDLLDADFLSLDLKPF